MRPMDQEKYQPWVSLLFWKCLCNALAPWYDCRVYAPFMFLLISQRTVVQAHTHNAREQKNVLFPWKSDGSPVGLRLNLFCFFRGIKPVFWMLFTSQEKQQDDMKPQNILPKGIQVGFWLPYMSRALSATCSWGDLFDQGITSGTYCKNDKI